MFPDAVWFWVLLVFFKYLHRFKKEKGKEGQNAKATIVRVSCIFISKHKKTQELFSSPFLGHLFSYCILFYFSHPLYTLEILSHLQEEFFSRQLQHVQKWGVYRALKIFENTFLRTAILVLQGLWSISGIKLSAPELSGTYWI